MCRDCVNRTEYNGLNRARCILHNIEVYEDAGSCVFEETDPAKRATEVLVPTAKNTYDFHMPFGECKIMTMCVGGYWYGGKNYSIRGHCGAYSTPHVFGIAHSTEYEAINDIFDRLIYFSRDYPKAIAFLKDHKFQNAQLSLF